MGQDEGLRAHSMPKVHHCAPSTAITPDITPQESPTHTEGALSRTLNRRYPGTSAIPAR